MNGFWTVERWRLAAGIQSGRMVRKSGGMTTVDGYRVAHALVDAFTAAGLVELGDTGVWAWTAAGQRAYRAESARRLASIAGRTAA